MSIIVPKPVFVKSKPPETLPSTKKPPFTVTVVFAASVMELALRSKSCEPIKVKSPFQICGNAARALPEKDASKVVP